MSRILYFNTFEVIGGGEISLLTLILGLKQQHEVTVICPPGELSEKLKKLDINVVPVRIKMLKPIRIKFCRDKYYVLNIPTCFYNMFLFTKATFRLNRVIRCIKPHLIHANTLESIGLIIVPALLNKASIVWHVRILLQDKSPTIRFYTKIVSKFVKRVIANSNAVKRRLVKSGMNPIKIEVIYNPIDTGIFSPRNKYYCRRKLNLPVHSTIIGSLGRLTPDKGFDLFLKAAALVRKKHPNTYFLIAGQEWSKNYRAKLINIAQHLGLCSHLILIDWQQDAPSLISSLNMLVLTPMEKEGFGRTLAESMACEVPVIGTNVGGIAEIINNRRNGLLIPSGDEKTLAEAMCILLENRQFALQLAKHGRKNVEAKFSSHLHIHKINKIYKELMQSSTKG